MSKKDKQLELSKEQRILKHEKKTKKTEKLPDPAVKLKEKKRKHGKEWASDYELYLEEDDEYYIE